MLLCTYVCRVIWLVLVFHEIIPGHCLTFIHEHCSHSRFRSLRSHFPGSAPSGRSISLIGAAGLRCFAMQPHAEATVEVDERFVGAVIEEGTRAAGVG